jgi:hypothetical protein
MNQNLPRMEGVVYIQNNWLPATSWVELKYNSSAFQPVNTSFPLWRPLQMFPSLVDNDQNKDDLRSEYVFLKSLQVHGFKSYRTTHKRDRRNFWEISSSYTTLLLTRIEKVLSQHVHYSCAMLSCPPWQKVAIIEGYWSTSPSGMKVALATTEPHMTRHVNSTHIAKATSSQLLLPSQTSKLRTPPTPNPQTITLRTQPPHGSESYCFV